MKLWDNGFLFSVQLPTIPTKLRTIQTCRHYEFFGFVPPLSVPAKHSSPINLAPDQLYHFATTVGIKSLDSGFKKFIVIQYCWEFVHSFKSGSILPSKLYNLAIGNYIFILGATCSQFLHWMKDGNFFSLVLPLLLASVPWHLTVTNTIDVLFLCYLNSTLTDYELCCIFIQCGIEFHALPSCIILPTILTLPVCLPGYQFMKNERGYCLVTCYLSSKLLHSSTISATLYGQGISFPTGSLNVYLWDDIFSETELNMLYSLVYCYTGKFFYWIWYMVHNMNWGCNGHFILYIKRVWIM